MLLSRGYPILKNFANDPHRELERAFREGSEEDVQVLFSILPGLLRYSRAAKLIEQHLYEARTSKGNSKKGPRRAEDTDMLSGAMLISKLHYNEKELQRRQLETLVKEGVEELSTILKTELEKALLERQKLQKALDKASFPKRTMLEKRRAQILPLLHALSATIQRLEARRSKDFTGPKVHLIDQLLAPEGAYSHALPITYSVLYSTVINSLAQLHQQAVGIPFPQYFLSRIVVKDAHHANTNINVEEFVKSGPAQFNRRKDLQNVPKQVSFMELLGNWVGFYTSGMQEVRLNYDKATRTLEAVRIDGDENLPAGQVAWSIDLSTICRKNSFLAMNTPYNVSVQVAQRGYLHTHFAPYTLTIAVLPASIFQPVSLHHSDYTAEEPYFEIQLAPLEAQVIPHDLQDHANTSETDSNSTSMAMRSVASGPHSVTSFAPTTIARTHNNSSTHPSLHTRHTNNNSNQSISYTHPSTNNNTTNHSLHTNTTQTSQELTGPAQALRSSPRPRAIPRAATSPASAASPETQDAPLESLVFCRTVDLDRCLYGFSDAGVMPLTPMTYLKLMSM